MPGLEIRGIVLSLKGFDAQFDLSVPAGSCTALVGPSGAGKSTLLSLIAGFERAQAGSIRFGDAEIHHLPPDRRPVAMLFQEHNLFPHLTVAENVGLGIDPGLRLDTGGRQKVAAAIERVGLAGKEARRPAELSGGERQRAALARTVAQDRPLLLLDEPFSALDPALRLDMLELVDSVRREHRRTVVMVSHRPEDARHVAARTAFLQEGRILVEGLTETVLHPLQTPEIAAYLGETER